MNTMLKNIETEQVITLANLISFREHEVVSRTLAQNDNVSITLFGFDKGEEISTHASHGDALVNILEGIASITINNNHFIVKAGESIVMPADLPHSLYAQESFKMMLTVVFPQNKGEN